MNPTKEIKMENLFSIKEASEWATEYLGTPKPQNPKTPKPLLI